MKTKVLFFAILSIVVIISSCSKGELSALEEKLILPEETYDYASATENVNPFPFDNTPEDNQITDLGATLGRVLFNDKRLSKSNLISCSSCHLPQNGFGDSKALSTGFVHEETRRNSMPIVNLRNKFNFFWDGRETVLEEQVLRPVADHVEMGLDDEELVPKLEQIEYYPDLFEDAFGDSDITRERISKAISQYLRAMISSSSKYDEGRESNFENFTTSAFSLKELIKDEENNFQMQGFFSIPSLRNVSLTGPYMHDGRFNTLEEVISHYESGVQAHNSLDSRLRFGFTSWNQQEVNPIFQNTEENSEFGDPLRFSLSDTEKQDLINFMLTLTDMEFITDPRFSNPFVYSE